MKFQANQTKPAPTASMDAQFVTPEPVVAAELLQPIDLGGIVAPKPVGYALEAPSTGGKLYGSELADELLGGNGADTLYGQGGDDRLFGRNGNDVLVGGEGADVLDGGAGRDWVAYHTSSQGVTVSLEEKHGFGGDAEGDTYANIENVLGSNHADTIFGNSGDNHLMGGRGDDQISGGLGKDIISGGGGQDILTGDSDGVVHSDIFVFERNDGGRDTIMDYQGGTDKIDLSAFGFGGQNPFGADGVLAQAFIISGDLENLWHIDESDRFVFEQNSNTLWECRYEDETLILLDPIARLDGTNWILTANDLIV